MRVCFVSKESGKEVFYIPAPFMTDANGISSAAANFEVRTTDSGLVHFSVTADAEWMNASNRAFPVTIDPQIKLADSASISTYSWENGLIHNDSLHKIGTVPTQASSGANTPSDTSSTSNTMKTAIQIALNTWQSGRIGCCYDEVWYKFVANSANAHVNGNPGEYTIYTQGSLDTMGSLYDSRGNLLTNNDDIGSQRNFRIVTNLTKGATYYLKVSPLAEIPAIRTQNAASRVNLLGGKVTGSAVIGKGILTLGGKAIAEDLQVEAEGKLNVRADWAGTAKATFAVALAEGKVPAANGASEGVFSGTLTIGTTKLIGKDGLLEEETAQ